MTKRFFHRISRYFNISREERVLFSRALFLLVVWKAKIVFLPMPAYVKYFGEKGVELNFPAEGNEVFIKKVQLSIRRADSVLPWKSKCLTEAIATKRMLEFRKIKSTLLLGVAKDEKEKLIAHAWLILGNRIISGERGHEKFTVVQKFS